MYKMTFTASEWEKNFVGISTNSSLRTADVFPVVASLPPKTGNTCAVRRLLFVEIPTKMPPFTEKGYFINTRLINRTAKCATCKTELRLGDIQASTEGPQRTIQR